jgi:hypothetical protein
MSNQKQEKTSEIANTKVLSYKEKLENKILEIEETLKKGFRRSDLQPLSLDSTFCRKKVVEKNLYSVHLVLFKCTFGFADYTCSRILNLPCIYDKILKINIINIK